MVLPLFSLIINGTLLFNIGVDHKFTIIKILAIKHLGWQSFSVSRLVFHESHSEMLPYLDNWESEDALLETIEFE
jgi:hypothetical protein